MFLIYALQIQWFEEMKINLIHPSITTEQVLSSSERLVQGH